MASFEDGVRLSCLEWASALPESNDFQLSRKSERYFCRLSSKMKSGVCGGSPKHILRFALVAALIAALFAAFSVGALTGTQDFNILPQGDMARYEVVDPHPPFAEKDLEVPFIVSGFEVSDILYDSEYITGYEYNSPNGSGYSLTRYDNDGSFTFDCDNFNGMLYTHNNIRFTYFESDSGKLGVVWNYGGYIYMIAGSITLEEAFNVADSIYY